MSIRIIPNLPKIKAHWCHRCSEVPDWLEVPMSDNRVIRYYPQIEQPAFTKSMEIIRHMTDPQTGYKRKGPASAATLDRAQIK